MTDLNKTLSTSEDTNLQKLLGANKKFKKDFDDLCQKFAQRVVVWTPEVCFLAKKCFEDLFKAYNIGVVIDIKPTAFIIKLL